VTAAELNELAHAFIVGFLAATAYADDAADIHYLDAGGKEIPPDIALAKKK
jgi:hypothetical protein